MKLVYELISLVELKSVDELRHIHDVPTDPTVVVHTNKRIGSGSLFIPDVALGKVAHEGVRLSVSCLSTAKSVVQWSQCACQRYKA